MKIYIGHYEFYKGWVKESKGNDEYRLVDSLDKIRGLRNFEYVLGYNSWSLPDYERIILEIKLRSCKGAENE